MVLCTAMGFAPGAAHAADKAELQQRIDQLKSDLALAKDALKAQPPPAARLRALNPEEARRQSRALATQENRRRTLEGLEEESRRKEEERRSAARALYRLENDLRLDRSRKLEELLLDRLRQ